MDSGEDVSEAMKVDYLNMICAHIFSFTFAPPDNHLSYSCAIVMLIRREKACASPQSAPHLLPAAVVEHPTGNGRAEIANSHAPGFLLQKRQPFRKRYF
jgi:hypothetical protein